MGNIYHMYQTHKNKWKKSTTASAGPRPPIFYLLTYVISKNHSAPIFYVEMTAVHFPFLLDSAVHFPFLLDSTKAAKAGVTITISSSSN